MLGRVMRMPHVWPVLAATERFDRLVQGDVENGLDRAPYVSDECIWFLRGWTGGAFETFATPEPSTRDAQLLARNVVRTYRVAHDYELDAHAVEAIVDAWRANPGRNVRRLLRLLVHRLDATRPLELNPPLKAASST